MSDYFWRAVDWVYDHRLTPAEGAGACASGATVGSPGGYIGAGAGCGSSVIIDIISKFFDIHLTYDRDIWAPTIPLFDTGSFSNCDTSASCPDTHGDYDTSASCPISDFGGFGTNSNDYPTVSSGWV